MRSLINRYIVKEIFSSFFLILAILTVILLLGRIFQIMDLILNKGVSLGDILFFIFLLLPSLFLYSLPISLLFSILIALSRLSMDNELTILKTSGMSLYQLSIPIIFVSGLVFFAALLNSYFFLPWGNVQVRSLMYKLACNKATAGIGEKTFNDYFSGIILYADKIPPNGRYLEGVFISDFRHGKEPASIVAQKAYFIGDPVAMRITLRLQDGNIHLIDKGTGKYRRLDFREYDVKLDFAPSITEGTGKKSSREMTVREMKAAIRGKAIEERDRRELEIELYERLAIPFTGIIFGLLAIPLGIKSRRTDRYLGFTFGLATVLVFYTFRGWSAALGETGQIHPFLGAWLPNILLGLTGLGLLFFSAREKSITLKFHRRGTP